MMETMSFKQLRKTGEISGADDLFKVAFNKVKVQSGFNERHDRPELQAHIDAMADFVRGGGKLMPLQLDSDFNIRDGHCRYAAYQILVDAGEMAADQIIQFLPFRGSELDAVATIASSNNGLPLTPLERARVYVRLRSLIQAEEPAISKGEVAVRIAAKVGKSRGHVDQMLILADAGDEVHAKINGGTISSTEAVKIARDHGENAGQEIERRQEKAKESGKEKVTAKTAKQKPAKVSNALEQAARGLISSLDERDKERCLLAQIECVEVDAGLLAELIEAVGGGVGG